MNYTVATVFWNHKISILQRSQIRDWRGVDLCEDKKIVYVTRTGTVYHRNIHCSHLKLKISPIIFRQVTHQRNVSGAKYKKCEKCVYDRIGEEETVFITEDGKHYHHSIHCSGLRRYIMELDEKEVGKRTPCIICGGTNG